MFLLEQVEVLQLIRSRFFCRGVYQTKIDKKLSLFSSISYKLESDLTSNNTQYLSSELQCNFTTVDSEDQVNDTEY
jgi:hypothetical protein